MALSPRLQRAAPAEGASGPSPRQRAGVEANSRLTATDAVVLLVLLAAEGVTLLSIHRLVVPHVFLGMMLVPPVALKIGTTGYRLVRYYTGAPAYREKGPPPWLLRLLGPLVVVSTGAVLASGVALLYLGGTARQDVLLLHKASFVLWFGAMTLHVLSHLADTARLAPRDLVARTRRSVAGAGLRLWTIAGGVALGALLGTLLIGRAGHFPPMGG